MDIPIACTLSPTEMADRRGLWQSIDGDIAERRSGSKRLEIVYAPSPEVERVLPSLVDAESRCCAFASWSLRRDGEGIVLSIEAPPDGITALAQEFGFPPEIQEEDSSKAARRPPTPNPYKAWPEGYRAWKAMSDVVYRAGIDPILLNLMMVRASQINGCAYCLDMHTTDAVAAGEEHHRLHAVAAWRDVPWFTDAERAALELAEVVTRLGDGRGIPDDIVSRVAEHHGEEGYAKLLMALVVINGWNRINVACHVPPRRRT